MLFGLIASPLVAGLVAATATFAVCAFGHKSSSLGMLGLVTAALAGLYASVEFLINTASEALGAVVDMVLDPLQNLLSALFSMLPPGLASALQSGVNYLFGFIRRYLVPGIVILGLLYVAKLIFLR